MFEVSHEQYFIQKINDIKNEETRFSSSLSEQDLKRHVNKIINELKNRKEK
ncbi:MAG: hypothetical protein MRJ93_14580 [Nitrososphaeraceae archaeon]|nr:hypothetical protein [Nitrososphaeraceae archaeon]